MALSSLILNHETIVHDTLLCSAQIWLFTVSTEIWQARLLSLNSLGQMDDCHNLFFIFLSAALPLAILLCAPSFYSTLAVNFPTLPVQIDKFTQRHKNKWKREESPLKGIIFAEGKMWLTGRRTGEHIPLLFTRFCTFTKIQMFFKRTKTVLKLKL